MYVTRHIESCLCQKKNQTAEKKHMTHITYQLETVISLRHQI